MNHYHIVSLASARTDLIRGLDCLGRGSSIDLTAYKTGPQYTEQQVHTITCA